MELAAIADLPSRELRDKTGEPFRVRRYTEADRSALQEFYECFEPKRAAQGLPPTGRDRIARWLNAVVPAGLHLLADRGTTLIGHALLIPTGRPDTAEYAIFLDRGSRGRGIGTAINRAAAEVGRAAGLRRLWLSVEPHNRAALRSYEKAGFRFVPGTVFSPEAEMELEL